MRYPVLSGIILAAATTAACFGYERRSIPTGPSGAGVSAMMGNWTSSSVIPSPSTCTDFKWNVSEQTPTSAKGSFAATCAGDLKVAGTAEGSLAGSGVTWKANGTTSAPGLPSCDVALVGTAELRVDSIRIPYSGTTCLGPVSGVEILQRR